MGAVPTKTSSTYTAAPGVPSTVSFAGTGPFTTGRSGAALAQAERQRATAKPKSLVTMSLQGDSIDVGLPALTYALHERAEKGLLSGRGVPQLERVRREVRGPDPTGRSHVRRAQPRRRAVERETRASA